MWRVFIYQWRVNFDSLNWWVMGLCTVSLTLIINGIGQTQDGVASPVNSLSALEALLMTAWAIQGIYFPYVASVTATVTKESGLLGWWLASGISPWKVVWAQSLAILSCGLIYLLGIVSPLILWLLRAQALIHWRLLGEHHLLYLLSGEILLLLSFFLGAFCSPLIATLLGSGFWIISISGRDWIASLFPNLPSFLGSVVGWIWYLLPHFDLYHRPMAIVYFWPAIKGSLWISLLGYSCAYGVALLVLCECTYRPKFFGTAEKGARTRL